MPKTFKELKEAGESVTFDEINETLQAIKTGDLLFGRVVIELLEKVELSTERVRMLLAWADVRLNEESKAGNLQRKSEYKKIITYLTPRTGELKTGQIEVQVPAIST